MAAFDLRCGRWRSGTDDVILTYERQILAWEDQAYFADSDGRSAMPIESLIEQASSETFTPQSVTIAQDPRAPVVLRQGRSGQVVVNPHSEWHLPLVTGDLS